MTDCVALIPMRSDSKRIPHKNVRPLAGQPLMAYTIAAARASGVFRDILVSTDSEAYADIARRHGAWAPFLRPSEFATDESPDIEWVRFTLETLRNMGYEYDAFSILRVTSPFRSADTIRAAWQHFLAHPQSDSLRAVAPCRSHPYKAWVQSCSSRIVPLMAGAPDWYAHGAPGHSRQHTTLPAIYSQTASLEIAWCRTVFEKGSIAGEDVLPFFVEGEDAFDLNTEADWFLAETLIARGEVALPEIAQEVQT